MEKNLHDQNMSDVQVQGFENKQRNWRNILLFVLIGAVLLLITFYAGIKYSASKQNQTTINLPTPSIESSIAPDQKFLNPTISATKKLKVVFYDNKGNVYKSDVNGENKETIFTSYTRSENQNFRVMPNGEGILICKNKELFLSKNNLEVSLIKDFPCNSLNSFVWSSDKKKVMFSTPWTSSEKFIRHIYDFDNKSEIKIITPSNSLIGGVFAWSEKKNEIYATNPTMNAVTKIIVLDLKTGIVKAEYPLFMLNYFHMDRDNSIVALGNGDLSIIDMSTGKILKNYKGLGFNRNIGARFLTLEKKLFAQVDRDYFYNGVSFQKGDFILIDPLTGTVEKFTNNFLEPDSSMGTFSPDGSWFYYLKIVGKGIEDSKLPEQDIYEMWTANKDGTQKFMIMKRFGSGGISLDWLFEK